MTNRVRITAQLIDTATGNHLWSERFDRTLEAIFDVQDEVVRTIVATLEGRLAATIVEQAGRKRTEHLGAYDLVLQGRHFINTLDTAAAEPLLRRAIELDPAYAPAHAWLALACLAGYFSDLRASLLDEGLELAKKAVALDAHDAHSHAALGEMYLFRREFDEAGISMERALALNPSDPQVIANHAHWLCRVGRYEEALSEYDLVFQRDPFPPSWYWEGRAIALFALQRYEDAIQSVRKMDRLYFWDYAVLAACYALLGRMDKARAAASEVLKMKPDFAIRDMMLQEPWKNPAEIERELDGLRKAGLPE